MSATAMIRAMVFIVMAVHAVILAWGACHNSATRNEIDHLIAGISHWELEKFGLFRVNPPLVRTLAAIPVLAVKPRTDWRGYDASVGVRAERFIRDDFVEANRDRVFRLVTLARWACIPLSLLGGYVCYRWACRLHGRIAALFALSLWCFCPYILGHAQLITADVGAAALGVTAAYALWMWLREPSWLRTLLAGTGLGFAELTKTTWILLFVLWPVLWLLWRLPRPKGVTPTSRIHEFVQMTVIVGLGLSILNSGYGFEGSLTKLGDYAFVSKTLGGAGENSLPDRQGGNRFAGTWPGQVRVPLPINYLMGIDIQKHDFERGLPSCLRGQWSDHGWWYYYLYALAVKVPLGTWCLAALAVGMTIFSRSYNAPWRDELILLTPGLMILAFVSSQTGFSVHSRYVIPAMPFLFIWTSKVGRVFDMRPFTRGRRAIATMVVVALTWSVGSSLWAYPHSLSYFNELVGGPKNGGKHLLDSNIDWGQDLQYLKDWLSTHPTVRLDGLAYWNSYPATIAGIPETPHPPPGPPLRYSMAAGDNGMNEFGPRPGWYALSVNEIYSRDRQYCYFLDFEPIASAGYSIYIYHITLDEANRARRELGLPEIQETKEPG
ncbi:MAG: hypothetical protein NTW96_25315 [Planctomycetia bacterium]|nr:hypothetical protein [Planctomycetia bacterium]